MLRAFPSLRWLSFWAVLSWLIRLPKYTKSLTTSTGSLFMVMHALALVLMDIALVLVVLIMRPVCRAYLVSQSVFWCRCLYLWKEQQGHQQSQGLRAGLHRVHWMPRCLAAVVFRIIQSMAVRKRIGERMQPWRTPDFTGNEMVLPSTTVHSNWS